MGWFANLCRNTGLMIHNIRHPGGGETNVVRKDVEEEHRGTLTLRRTTIEEIEFNHGADSQAPNGEGKDDHAS